MCDDMKINVLGKDPGTEQWNAADSLSAVPG